LPNISPNLDLKVQFDDQGHATLKTAKLQETLGPESRSDQLVSPKIATKQKVIGKRGYCAAIMHLERRIPEFHERKQRLDLKASFQRSSAKMNYYDGQAQSYNPPKRNM